MARSLSRLEVSQLVGGTLTALLYGIFLVLAILSYYVLITRLKRSPSSRRIHGGLLIALTLFVGLSTTNFIVYTSRTATAFLDLPSGPMQGQYLVDVTVDSYVVINGTFGAMIHVGDLVIIWRCWVVWRDARSIVVPALLSIASIVCYTVALAKDSQASTGADVFARAYQSWLLAFGGCSLAANLLSTLLIAARLFYIDHQTRKVTQFKDSAIRRAIAIIVESNMLNAATLIVYEVALAAHLKFFHVVAVIELYAVPISFSLIIIRVGLYGSSPISYHMNNVTIRPTPLTFKRSPADNWTSMRTTTTGNETEARDEVSASHSAPPIVRNQANSDNRIKDTIGIAV